ncbi:MAG TPA: hypothetical protein VFZ00_17015, partial [Solirubrobacter sp.]|nr:hypothetical protein [Solirubrobacter sp.]
AVLGLGLALLGPSSASADHRCGKRVLKGTMSATVTLTTATGAFTGDGIGVATHLGRFTGTQRGTIAPTGDGHFAGVSTWTIVAANGDTLTGTATMTVEGPPGGEHTTTSVATITGGSGRFADATGRFTTVYRVTPVSVGDGKLHNRAEGQIKGYISY